MNYVKDLNKILRTNNYYYNEEKLKHFFCNKKVAVIGSAKYLEELNQANKLVDYDIIVRLNSVYKIKGESGTDIPPIIVNNTTDRTDVIYSNWNHLQEKGATDLERLLTWEKNNVKLVISVTPNNPLRLMNFKNQFDFYVRKCNKENLDVKLRYSLINNDLDALLYRKIDSWALSGISTVLHLLQMPIRQLYITGFDFYENNIVSYDGYSQDNVVNETGNHKLDSQKKVFIEILNTYRNRIKIDNYLNVLLTYPLPNFPDALDGLFVLPYSGNFNMNSFFFKRYITKYLGYSNYTIKHFDTVATTSWKYICNYFPKNTTAKLCALVCNEHNMLMSYLQHSHLDMNQTYDSKSGKDISILKGYLAIVHPKVITKFNENYKITVFFI